MTADSVTHHDPIQWLITKLTRSKLLLGGHLALPQNTTWSYMQMLLPMEMRSCRDPDAQQQYAPFRSTVFTDHGDELAAARGPGALYREEWNSWAGNARRYKPFSLYQTERDVNPTLTATVQQFYDPQNASDLGSQLKTKGNTVASLQSNVPRFHGSSHPQRGPGSYFPDRYHGAFPALFEKMTPSTVRLDKLQAKRALATTFGIVPAPTASSLIATFPMRDSPSKLRADIPLETTRLAPALTPRNAYQNTANRQFILSMKPGGSISPS